MHTENCSDSIQHILFHHPFAACAHFLARLEDKPHFTSQFFRMARQEDRCPAQHGHVAVMSASMHTPGNFGGVFQPGFLFYFEAVHIGT